MDYDKDKASELRQVRPTRFFHLFFLLIVRRLGACVGSPANLAPIQMHTDRLMSNPQQGHMLPTTICNKNILTLIRSLLILQLNIWEQAMLRLKVNALFAIFFVSHYIYVSLYF